MINRAIKGAIFDLDGVLLDSMLIWKDLGARYLMSIGVEPEEGLGTILFSMSMEQAAEYLVDHYSLDKTPEDVGRAITEVLKDFYYDEVKTKEGAKELLEKFSAAGIRITAATSSPRGHITAALERNGLLGYIEKIFTNAEVGSSKHTPEIYDAAAGFMGTERGETYVFEDSQYALETAAAAGFVAVGVFDAHGASDQESMKKTAAVYLEDLTQVEKLL